MAIENSNREIRMESLSEAEETRNTAAEEIGAKQTEVEENVTPATAASMQTPAEDGASAPSQTCAAQEPAAASDATAGGAVAEEPASGVAETDARKDDDAEPESAESAEPETEEADEESSGAVSEDDLSGKSKEELVDMFARMLETEPVQTLRKSMEAIKVAFYKLHRAEVEAARKAFEATAAEGEEFVPAVDALEVRLKDLFKEYRRRRDEYMANLDSIKEENLKAKLAIIDELKELVNSDETLNHTFAKFRELQQRWKEIGVVPQQNVKDLWETYNLHVENFYNFIKINKELRDLDLKKNYEQKLQLCEQAEALITEPSTVEAFHKLQKLHDEWRETGPVANEYKDALWERFKAASTRINKQHQEYFERIKQEQMKNLIQKIWRTIGFAPKKDNTRIYERFRAACDKFFEAKREFYAGVKNDMEHNLQLKTELCEAAEALQESSEWKQATEELIALQGKWSKIGPVPRRYSDQIWKRFRAACDHFFERKSQHFSQVEGEHEENLRRKLALIEEMRTADVKAGGYDVIKDFQRRWSEIGFVPIKQKDAVQKSYKEVVDAMFDALRGSERDRSMSRFRDRLQSMKSSGDKRLRSERERLYNKVRQLEQDIALLENNVGFFSKSKNAEAVVADIREKIAASKQQLQDMIEKVRLIDSRAAEEAKTDAADPKEEKPAKENKD